MNDYTLTLVIDGSVFSDIIDPSLNCTLLRTYNIDLTAYKNGAFLLFVLIIFNDEDLLCAFLNKEQQSNQPVLRVTKKDTKENKIPESVSYGCS